MNDFDIGEMNVSAMLLRKTKERQPSGAIIDKWERERELYVSIQDEKKAGKIIEYNDTDCNSMTVVIWDQPVTTDHRLEIDGIQYEITGIKVLQRNYYKQITLMQYAK